jgi:hypothetical protein
MKHKRSKRKQKAEIHIGQFRIVNFAAGKFWISNGDGEGMETSEKKLAQHIEIYFQREM